MGLQAKPLAELLEQQLRDREELRARQAQELRSARAAQDATQQEFADAAGITQSYLSKVENGIQTVSTSTLNSMHGALAALSTGGTGNASYSISTTAKEDAAKARNK